MVKLPARTTTISGQSGQSLNVSPGSYRRSDAGAANAKDAASIAEANATHRMTILSSPKAAAVNRICSKIRLCAIGQAGRALDAGRVTTPQDGSLPAEASLTGSG